MSTPSISDFKGPTYLDDYKAAWLAWEASPEGIESKKREQERKQEEQRRFDRRLDEEIESLVDRMPVPSRAKDAAKGKIEQTEAVKASLGSTDFLVLSGGPGCGKTVAAVAWVIAYVRDKALWSKDICDQPRFSAGGPIWVTAARLARWERYDEDAMRKLLSTPRLVIDDLGGEYLDKGGFYASLLDEIVNERQSEGKPTIMTTNLNAEAFKVRYGERIADRIREGGRFVECGSASLRKAAP